MCSKHQSICTGCDDERPTFFFQIYRGKLEVHISNSREKESLLFTLQLFQAENMGDSLAIYHVCSIQIDWLHFRLFPCRTLIFSGIFWCEGGKKNIEKKRQRKCYIVKKSQCCVKKFVFRSTEIIEQALQKIPL